MAERKLNPGDPNQQMQRALRQAIDAFDATAHVDDLGQAKFREALLADEISRDKGFNRQQVFLATLAFQRTLGRSKLNPVQDAAFLEFLQEQAVFAAKRDGIKVDQARNLQPTLPGMEDPIKVVIETVTPTPQSNTQRALPEPSSTEIPTIKPELSDISTVSTPAHVSQEPMQEVLSRRALFTRWGTRAAVAVVGVGAAAGGVMVANALSEEYERNNPYEGRAKLTSEWTPKSFSSEIQFSYPQIEPGWELKNNYGVKAITSSLPSEGSAYPTVVLPWDQSNYPDLKKIVLNGVFLSVHNASDGSKVVKIKYNGQKQSNNEYVLIGHLTAPNDSFAKQYPEIVAIRTIASEQPLYLSMRVEDVDTKGNGKTEPRIKITTLEKVRKP